MSDNLQAFNKPVMGLLIDPLDTFFFRDGRPFGEGDVARGGLPLPQTLYGMIQHYLLHHHDAGCLIKNGIQGLREQKHEMVWLRSVAVRGPWLALGHAGGAGDSMQVKDVYFPAPAHLYRLGKDESGELILLNPLDKSIDIPGWTSPPWENGHTLRPLIHLPQDNAGDKSASKPEPAGGYVTMAGLAKILRGQVPKRDFKNITEAEYISSRFPKELFLRERRTGVGINSESSTALDGFLYTADHIRLASHQEDGHIVFYAEIGLEGGFADTKAENLRRFFPKQGMVLPFGGEGKRALITPCEPIKWPDPPQPLSNGDGGFTTMLISPGLFAHREGSSSEPWHPPCCGTLVAAAIERPLAVSGWSLSSGVERNRAKGVPKPTRYAADAGSVFFWQNGKHADPDKQYPAMYQLSHKPLDRAAGWGVALRGVWKWNKGAG